MILIFFLILLFFFASSSWKWLKFSWAARMDRNFDDYPGFQPKTTPAWRYAAQCTCIDWHECLFLVERTNNKTYFSFKLIPFWQYICQIHNWKYVHLRKWFILFQIGSIESIDRVIGWSWILVLKIIVVFCPWPWVLI